MASKCSKCQSSGVTAVAHLELPYDGHCDERSMSLVFCPQYDFFGIGIYTEKRWGPLGDESWNYYQEECSKEA